MKLAIKGHPTRGKEVIELLEMLGGKNGLGCNGHCIKYIYYVYNHTIICSDLSNKEYEIFTLEDFLEKYPYKVGDEVCYQPNPQIDAICISEIIAMRWLNNDVIYITNNAHELYACDLQPYKEETIEESANKAIFEGNAQYCDIMNDIIKKAMERIKIDIPEGYKFDCIDDNNKIVLTKIQPQYPKTYQECCEVLGIGSYFEPEIRNATTEECHKFGKLMRLKRCRDAYWKIAGEQMGLGKPWEPDWDDKEQIKFIIFAQKGYIRCDEYIFEHRILAFPTKEMRDAFYKNFKELIEECKELV